MNTSLSTAQDVKNFLWVTYDSNDDLIFPTVDHWDLLLLNVMADGKYDNLSRDEVLSMLFGAMHRSRHLEGFWESLFTRGVTQKLVQRLKDIEIEALG